MQAGSDVAQANPAARLGPWARQRGPVCRVLTLFREELFALPLGGVVMLVRTMNRVTTPAALPQSNP